MFDFVALFFWGAGVPARVYNLNTIGESETGKTEKIKKFLKKRSACAERRYSLQIRLDLFDHRGVFLVAESLLSRIHGEHAAPLELILVLGDEVEVQMAAGIAV